MVFLIEAPGQAALRLPEDFKGPEQWSLGTLLPSQRQGVMGSATDGDPEHSGRSHEDKEEMVDGSCLHKQRLLVTLGQCH